MEVQPLAAGLGMVSFHRMYDAVRVMCINIWGNPYYLTNVKVMKGLAQVWPN